VKKSDVNAPSGCGRIRCVRDAEERERKGDKSSAVIPRPMQEKYEKRRKKGIRDVFFLVSTYKRGVSQEIADQVKKKGDLNGQGPLNLFEKIRESRRHSVYSRRSRSLRQDDRRYKGNGKKKHRESNKKTR